MLVLKTTIATEAAPFPEAAASPISTEVPKIKTGLFVKTDNRYEIRLALDSFAFLPQTLFGALIVLNQTPFRQSKSDAHLGIYLTSRSLRQWFQFSQETTKKVLDNVPKANEYEMGEVILLFDEIILRREEDLEQRALWRLIPKDGEKLSEAELLVLNNKLGLKEKVPEKEPYGISMIEDNLTHKGQLPGTFRTKGIHPDTTVKKEIQITRDVSLYMRMNRGNRIWVALPKNKRYLSPYERSVIEEYLKPHRIKPQYKKVTEDDIICSGSGEEKYFRKRNPGLPNESTIKLPDPNTWEEEFFIPEGKEWEPLIFEIKVNEHREKVWTTHKDQYKKAEEYLCRIRSQCSYLKSMSQNAVALSGSYAEIFWEDPPTDEFIRREIIDPYSLNDEHIAVKSSFGDCEVFLGKINDEYFLWVERRDYPVIAEILDLQPKESTLKRVTRRDSETFAVLINVPNIDVRKDGTDDLALSAIRKSSRFY